MPIPFFSKLIEKTFNQIAHDIQYCANRISELAVLLPPSPVRNEGILRLSNGLMLLEDRLGLPKPGPSARFNELLANPAQHTPASQIILDQAYLEMKANLFRLNYHTNSSLAKPDRQIIIDEFDIAYRRLMHPELYKVRPA